MPESVVGQDTAKGGLRILFALGTPEYLRFYDSTLRLLADRGHRVAVAVSSLRERKPARLDLINDDRIAITGLVPKRRDVWTFFARAVRRTMDCVRYLHPYFADTPVLRTRMRRFLPPLVRPLGWVRSVPPALLAKFIRLLQAFEEAVPVSTTISRFLQAERPDVVVVSPLVDVIVSDQVDTVRAARAANIPVVVGIASWDNLTSKGHLRVDSDAVLVWNEQQRREAVDLHGVPPQRVIVTGAQVFDRWFERRPSMSRQAFCEMVSLSDDRPFVLFTGSSRFVGQTKQSKNETPLIREWVTALRNSEDPLLQEVAVLLRPHPFSPSPWKPADFSGLGPIAVWPREPFTPAAEQSRTSLFDSLSYCEAVVGINTTVMIEAAILRKPVLSVLTPAFADLQDGTAHFRYLRREHGGFVQLAHSMDDHVAQLAGVLRGRESAAADMERFVGAFLRPHGMTTACTPMVADAIERAARDGCGAPRGAPLAFVLRMLLWPLALSMWIAATVRRPSQQASRGRPAARLVPPRRVRHALRSATRDMGRIWRRSAHYGSAVGALVVRLPRMARRRIRLARYYVATVVLQRGTRNRGNV